MPRQNHRAKAQKEAALERLQIWIPHGKKMAVRDLPPGSDPANPPLNHGEEERAALLTDELVAKYGKPAIIFTSPMMRCLQTARPATDEFGQHYKEGGALVVTLNTLCQPDSGDLDPDNPKSKERKDGLIIYGEETFSPQWYKWFQMSRDVINTFESMILDESTNDRPIFVFTHRPLVAAARWASQHNEGVLPGRDEIDALDKSLLPYCLFREASLEGWTEIPRT